MRLKDTRASGSNSSRPTCVADAKKCWSRASQAQDIQERARACNAAACTVQAPHVACILPGAHAS
eukprot:8874360-Pyramimonas_sp.AAC.1